MPFKRLLVLCLSLATVACSSSSGPEGSLDVSIGNSPLTLPADGSADIALTLTNTGGGTVIVDLCSDRIAGGLQEQISGVWVEAGANACGGSDRRSVNIDGGSSFSTGYTLNRPSTFRLRIPYRDTDGDFSEVTSPSFVATQ